MAFRVTAVMRVPSLLSTGSLQLPETCRPVSFKIKGGNIMGTHSTSDGGQSPTRSSMRLLQALLLAERIRYLLFLTHDA